MYECLYCGKTSFKTERGLDQHLARSSYCRGQHEVDDGDMTGYYVAYTTIVNQAKTKRSKHGNPPSETLDNTSYKLIPASLILG